MADSKRGGRSNSDDEFDENDDVFDELDDSDDDVDLDADDDADAGEKSRDRSSAVMARSGRSTTGKSASKSVTKTKDRDVSERGIVGRIGKFIREVVAELQKVIYPTRKELLTYTSVVLVFVTVVMTIVALLDVGFAKLMFLVFGDQTTT